MVLGNLAVGSPVALAEVETRSPVVWNAALGQAGMWTGHGPPVAVVGSKVGDEYLDLDTGDIYTLNPGP